MRRCPRINEVWGAWKKERWGFISWLVARGSRVWLPLPPSCLDLLGGFQLDAGSTVVTKGVYIAVDDEYGGECAMVALTATASTLLETIPRERSDPQWANQATPSRNRIYHSGATRIKQVVGTVRWHGFRKVESLKDKKGSAKSQT